MFLTMFWRAIYAYIVLKHIIIFGKFKFIKNDFNDTHKVSFMCGINCKNSSGLIEKYGWLTSDQIQFAFSAFYVKSRDFELRIVGDISIQ